MEVGRCSPFSCVVCFPHTFPSGHSTVCLLFTPPGPLHALLSRAGAMVVKTEKCAFSEYPIFPGHGMKFIRKDGQPIVLSGSKSKSLYLQRMKSSKLMWTQAWRRLNKKGNDAQVARKKTKRTVKSQRAIVGVSLEAVSYFHVGSQPYVCTCVDSRCDLFFKVVSSDRTTRNVGWIS